jgi:hypothetical protein
LDVTSDGRLTGQPPEECATADQTYTSARVHKITPVSLRELIHEQVRHAIEAVVHEEVTAVLGAAPSEPRGPRRG